MLENSFEITRIENHDDLECLVSGDVVELIYEYVSSWRYGEARHIAIYDQDEGRFKDFLIPRRMGKIDYFSRVSAKGKNISFRDGAIVLNEDKSSASNVDSTIVKYQDLVEKLPRVSGF